MNAHKLPIRRQKGVAAVEFALVLPLLLMLAVPVFDLARIVQGDMILTNLSREGANLASRSSQDPQTIMTALAMTTPPLDMATNGSMYISKIMGNGPGKSNVILEHYRWTKGAQQPSRVWTCNSWATDGSGKCSNIPSAGSAINDAMSNQLADGEVIYVVEGLYRSTILFAGMNLGFGAKTPQLSGNLYAKTIF
jgi:hypothetical protein